MNKIKLSRTIGLIDDDLILEANNTMKVRKTIGFRKIAVIAAIILLLSGITVLAGNIIVYYTVGSGYMRNEPVYDTLPSSDTIKKDIGLETNLLENFSNGYSFEAGNISYEENFDSEGNLIEEYKSLICYYKNKDNDIILGIDGSSLLGTNENSKIVSTYQGSIMHYVSYTNKLVPGDYQMTEQDKIDESSGKYVFSFGMPEPKTSQVQVLIWNYKGLNYSFTVIDSDITEQEMIEMAKEIIDKQG